MFKYRLVDQRVPAMCLNLAAAKLRAELPSGKAPHAPFDAAELPAYGGKMGIDATRKWASEGYSRSWPARIATTEEAGRRAAEIWTRIKR